MRSAPGKVRAGRAFVAALAWLLTAPVPAAETLPAWQPGPAGDLAFQTSPFIRTHGYPRPDRVGIHAAADGANRLNIAWEQGSANHWLIEEQRFALDPVVAGLAYHRQDLIDRGKAMIDWGFRHQRPDGSFDCADSFHSTSFFVEAVAHVLLLIRASDMDATNEAWVSATLPRLRAAARWLVRPEVAGPGGRTDARFGHRFYLDGAALGEAGVLLGDPDLKRAGDAYVRRGIARQDGLGFNPERGGPDTSYEAVGELLAETYYTLAADEAARAALRPMIERSLDWLAPHVRPDGTVDSAGNTRTGLGQELSPEGRPKTMSYGSAYRAAYYWGMITGAPRWSTLAERLFQGQRAEQAEQRPAASAPVP